MTDFKKSDVNRYLQLLLQVGLVMAGSIGFFFGVGFLVYRYLFSSITLLLIFTFLGVMVGFYGLYKKLVNFHE